MTEFKSILLLASPSLLFFKQSSSWTLACTQTWTQAGLHSLVPKHGHGLACINEHQHLVLVQYPAGVQNRVGMCAELLENSCGYGE